MQRLWCKRTRTACSRNVDSRTRVQGFVVKETERYAGLPVQRPHVHQLPAHAGAPPTYSCWCPTQYQSVSINMSISINNSRRVMYQSVWHHDQYQGAAHTRQWHGDAAQPSAQMPLFIASHYFAVVSCSCMLLRLGRVGISFFAAASK